MVNKKDNDVGIEKGKFDLSDIDKIAVIAGKGWLPRHVFDGCKEKGIECKIIAVKDQFSEDIFSGLDYEVFPVHAIGKIIKRLRSLEIKHVVLAGAVKRGNITKLLLDMKGSKLFAMIMKAGLNDNAVLTAIIAFLEAEGFSIVQPEYFATSIIAHSGFLTKVKPDAASFSDIRKGTEVLRAIAKFDVGQALVIQNGLVLGVEAAEGTDELIRRCGLVQQKNEDMCILIKVCKPNQDKRVDLPCMGEDTIKNLHEYNFKGVVLESGSTLILNKEKAIEEADSKGIFIYGI